MFGTISRGIKTPIFKGGDNLAKMVVDSVLDAVSSDGITLKNKDIVGITEAVLARTQGNYATLEQIAVDIKDKFGNDAEIGLVFPILSRNRFLPILEAISLGVKKIYLMLSYPSDEVGNPLITLEQLEYSGLNPYSDSITESDFRKIFPKISHPFTGVDYIKLYKDAVKCECDIILSNKVEDILKYTDTVLCADIHSRERSKSKLLKAGAQKVLTLADILTSGVDGSGYNKEYGLLGANLATDNSIKLFPRDSQKFVEEVQSLFFKRTGKTIEVLVYGDGAFKDPIGGIWELADPVVSPGFTKGLLGRPEEIKLKYIADNQLAGYSREEVVSKIKEMISDKSNNKAEELRLGTTPRRVIDLVGSLCDLMSGSGDKGTPVVLIQGYFDNFATEK